MPAISPLNSLTSPSAAYRIGRKFLHLLGAYGLKELLQQAFLIYLARQSTNTFGEFALALGMGYIIMFVADFGLNQPMVPLLTAKEADRGQVLSQVLVLKLGLLGASLASMLAFVHWQAYPPQLKWVVLIIGAGVGMEALANIFFVHLQVSDRQDLEGAVRALAAILGFGYGLVGLVLGLPPAALAFFKLIETCAMLLGGVLITLTTGGLRLALPSWSSLWGLARHGSVYAAMYIAAIIYNKSNLFFLQSYAGAEAVAQYSATWNLVDGLSVLLSTLLLRSVLFPLFVRLWGGQREQFADLAHRAARGLLGLAALIIFLLVVESDRIIGLVYGAGYERAIWMQRYLAATVAFAFLLNLGSNMMMAMGRERLLLVFYLAGLAANLLWCVLVLPASPLWGAVGAMLLSKGLVAALSVSFCQRRVGLLRPLHLAQLGGAALLGAGLWWLVGLTGWRLAAEGAAIAPLAVVGWYWWKELYRRRSPSQVA